MTDRISKRTDSNLQAEYDPNDLDWLAFRYVADELEPAERDAFEARLVKDDLAQQSVVDAVQQTQVLYSSLNSTSFNDVKEPVARPPRPFYQSSAKQIAILVASTAALLMLAIGWAWMSSPGGSDDFGISDSDQLASAWVATLVVMSNEELDEFVVEESLAADTINEDAGDWMFVALTDLEDAEGVDRETN